MDKKEVLDSQGFTLIEVLVSTLILVMVIGVAITALSSFMGLWEKSDKLFSNTFDSARHRILLRNSFESIYEYYITDKSNKTWSDTKYEYFPFFKGDSNSIEFITLSSVFHHDAPAVGMFYVKRNNSGSFDLIYKEADLEKFYIKYADDKINYSKQITLYQNLDEVRIRYYGVVDKSFNPDTMQITRISRWESSFFGKNRNCLPNRIEIRIKSEKTGAKTLLYYVKAENRYKNGLFNLPF